MAIVAAIDGKRPQPLTAGASLQSGTEWSVRLCPLCATESRTLANRLNRQQKYSTDNILKVSLLCSLRKLSQLGANVGNCPPKAEVVSSNLAGRASCVQNREPELSGFGDPQ